MTYHSRRGAVILINRLVEYLLYGRVLTISERRQLRDQEVRRFVSNVR